MPKKHRKPYPPEFKKRMVDLIRSGRSAQSLSKEFEPTVQAIRNWVKQADIDEGRRADGVTTDERAELARLRREVEVLREEREILKKYAAWSSQEANRTTPKRSGS